MGFNIFGVTASELVVLFIRPSRKEPPLAGPKHFQLLAIGCKIGIVLSK